MSMHCKKCEAPLVISEWDGWHWLCMNCDEDYGEANNEEIKEYEKEKNYES